MNKCYVAILSLAMTSFSAVTNADLWMEIEQDFSAMERQVASMVSAMRDKFVEVEKTLSFVKKDSRPTMKFGYERVTVETEVVGKEDTKKYRVVVHMPDFSKDNMSVALEKKDRRGNVLRVKATKDFKQEEKTKGGGVTRRAEAYSSTSLVNGMTQAVSYENGSLVVQIDLPASVAIDGKYEMAFEDECLTLTFPMTGKKSKSRKLSITK